VHEKICETGLWKSERKRLASTLQPKISGSFSCGSDKRSPTKLPRVRRRNQRLGKPAVLHATTTFFTSSLYPGYPKPPHWFFRPGILHWILKLWKLCRFLRCLCSKHARFCKWTIQGQLRWNRHLFIFRSDLVLCTETQIFLLTSIFFVHAYKNLWACAHVQLRGKTGHKIVYSIPLKCIFKQITFAYKTVCQILPGWN